MSLARAVSGLYLIVGLSLFWLVFKSNNLYIFFGLLFTTPLVEGIFQRIFTKGTTNNKRSQTKRKRKNKLPSGGRSNLLRSDKEIIFSSLDNLSWREFERLCFLYFKGRGYKPNETSEGADGGVDLVIYNPTHKTNEAVQIKHYLHSGQQITVKEIRELNSAKRNHNCILSMFITTSTYTKDALKQADQFKMDCHDYHWVVSKIGKWQEKERNKLMNS